ncbi:MAG TPA: hypothetical protein VEI97_04570 [bacterium]|nr:hypothetical protein [bacterium]
MTTNPAAVTQTTQEVWIPESNSALGQLIGWGLFCIVLGISAYLRSRQLGVAIVLGLIGLAMLVPGLATIVLKGRGLRIAPGGLTWMSGKRNDHYRWADVSEFGTRMVTMGAGGHSTTNQVVYFHHFPEGKDIELQQLKKPPEEVAALLNQWRAWALGQP